MMPSPLSDLSFSLFEVLNLIGFAQSLSILIHLLLHAGQLTQTRWPVFFFAALAILFAFEFSASRLDALTGQSLMIPFLWGLLVPLSLPTLYKILLRNRMKLQQITAPFAIYGSFALLGLAFYSFFRDLDGSRTIDNVLLSFGCGLSLLTLWQSRSLLAEIYGNARIDGVQRYWLSVTLLFLNCAVIAYLLLEEVAFQNDRDLIRPVMGLLYAYLFGTGLFRLFPSPLEKDRERETLQNNLDARDREIITAIERLLSVEKVYQDADYTREKMAEELKISEFSLSRLINIHFDQSVPQLLNSYRVREAQGYLRNTDLPIKTIAYESGFNSLATFNRVFKAEVGVTPTAYRDDAKNNLSTQNVS